MESLTIYIMDVLLILKLFSAIFCAISVYYIIKGFFEFSEYWSGLYIKWGFISFIILSSLFILIPTISLMPTLQNYFIDVLFMYKIFSGVVCFWLFFTLISGEASTHAINKIYVMLIIFSLIFLLLPFRTTAVLIFN